MQPKTVTKIFRYLSVAIPNPITELVYNSPFELLVAVILSAKTTDKIVNQVTKALFKKASTPHQLVALGENGVSEIIKSVGFHRSKTKHLINTSLILIARFKEKIPNTRAELELLPGVGRKTANVLLNILFNQSTIAVDTHVFRVANRLGLANSRNVKTVENELNAIVPTKFGRQAGSLLLLHGRYTCKALNPHCADCTLNQLCNYYTTTNAAAPASSR